MGAWSSDSKSHVAHMTDGDFFGTELAVTTSHADTLTIQHVDPDGNVTKYKEVAILNGGEIFDTSAMSYVH